MNARTIVVRRTRNVVSQGETTMAKPRGRSQLIRRSLIAVAVIVSYGHDGPAQYEYCTGWCEPAYYEAPPPWDSSPPNQSCPDPVYREELDVWWCNDPSGGCYQIQVGSWVNGGCSGDQEPSAEECENITEPQEVGTYMGFCRRHESSETLTGTSVSSTSAVVGASGSYICVCEVDVDWNLTPPTSVNDCTTGPCPH